MTEKPRNRIVAKWPDDVDEQLDLLVAINRAVGGPEPTEQELRESREMLEEVRRKRLERLRQQGQEPSDAEE